MASSPYKLSCVLFGHTLDVRALAVTQEGYIVSGSRDKTAKVWRPNGVNTGYTEFQTLTGHSNFVSSLCVLHPTSQHPKGLVVTGSNDTHIRLFVVETAEPIAVLKGHKNVVCSLSPGVQNGTFVSSSWDSTAMVWNSDGSGVQHVLSGHQMTVWSVIQLASGDIVTGSADKSIKLWLQSGVCQKTLTGHTDCVRGLAATSATEFLSVANDASVKHWNATKGTCLATFYGHGNYIYSVSVFPQGGAECFVTSGEDRTVRVWQGGEVEQTITLPAQSVWSVHCLANGDIIAGSSDGMVRVFSCDVKRQADPELIRQFDEQVASANLNTEQEIGGVKVSELPGKEALLVPGKTDGQTKLIREGTVVQCFKWSMPSLEWVKVGDVLGSNDGAQAPSGKVVYNNKEYDYVFSVDIEDGKPALKLPYNTDEDPWFAAQRFIHENNLSQLFLDQVANFIITNSNKVPPPSTSSTYCDPFTGGSRYIPGSEQAARGSPSLTDPFTGGSRYMPTSSTVQAPAAAAAAAAPTTTNGSMETDLDPFTGSSSYRTPQASACPSKPYFPQKTYVRFDQANLKVILEKLTDFNKKSGDVNHKIEESCLEGVVKLGDIGASANPLYMESLKQLLQWPQDILFPVLDVTRLAVRNEEVNEELCGGQAGHELFSFLSTFLESRAAPTNQMLTLRIFSNMLSFSAGEQLVLNHRRSILSALETLVPPFNKHAQVAVATLLLNIAVTLERAEDKESRLQAARVISRVLSSLSDSEAQFRALVALGTLLWEAPDRETQCTLINSIACSEEVLGVLNKYVATQNSTDVDPASFKVSQCAAQVVALIQKS